MLQKCQPELFDRYVSQGYQLLAKLTAKRRQAVDGKLKLSRFFENGKRKLSTFTASSIMMSSREPRRGKNTSKMIEDDIWQSIRVLHFRQGKSKNWLAKEFGLSRNTVAKYIATPDPPKYTIQQPRARPVMDKWEEHVRLMLKQDQDAPRKQHHTATRVFQRLVSEYGYNGSERSIRYLVANIRNTASQKAFLPLMFEPGKDAQVDFGESYAYIGGQMTRLYGFEMRLNYSRKKFVMYFPSPNTESFLEGHVQAFDFFGGVPERLSYDNLTLAVISVGKGKARKLTSSFKRLMGYYAFTSNFCTPGIKGAHEKGGVESGIGFSRRNWMVPVPRFETIYDLNEYIRQCCLNDADRVVRGQQQSIKDCFDEEKNVLMPHPSGLMDSGVRKPGSVVDAYQTMCFDGSRYSVPTKYMGKPLWFKAYWDRVQIGTGSDIIVEHPRSFSDGEYVLRPEHYFDLLERRPQAVTYARPILQTKWPDEYWNFYKAMQREFDASRAGRDFVRVLRLNAQYGQSETRKAVNEALESRVLSADFVKQILDRERYRSVQVESVDISRLPEFAAIEVNLRDTAEYQQLLIGGGEDEQHVA